MSKLLDVNAWNRIEFATAQPINQTNATTNNNAEVTISKKEYPVMFMTKEYLASINYDKIRLHPYFNDAVISDGEDNRAQLFSTIHLRSACVVPKLKEYCIRAVGRACSSVAEHIAKNGGVKPDINWIQVSSSIAIISSVITYVVEIRFNEIIDGGSSKDISLS